MSEPASYTQDLEFAREINDTTRSDVVRRLSALAINVMETLQTRDKRIAALEEEKRVMQGRIDDLEAQVALYESSPSMEEKEWLDALPASVSMADTYVLLIDRRFERRRDDR